jgi:hypothetical protein
MVSKSMDASHATNEAYRIKSVGLHAALTVATSIPRRKFWLWTHVLFRLVRVRPQGEHTWMFGV